MSECLIGEEIRKACSIKISTGFHTKFRRLAAIKATTPCTHGAFWFSLCRFLAALRRAALFCITQRPDFCPIFGSVAILSLHVATQLPISQGCYHLVKASQP